MNNLHVVYRVDEPATPREQWSTYSFPFGIYVTGTTLDEVRAEFRTAAAFALSNLDEFRVTEHLERPLTPGAYIRVAVDRRMLDRDATAALMRSSLQLVDQWQDFQGRVPPAATGDTVMIACVADDRLGWIFEQMSDHDAVGICAPGPAAGAGQFIWWSFILGQYGAGTSATDVESLASAGLDVDSTVSEFMQTTASSTGRQLLPAS
jgi:hypothetical protein